MTSTARSLGGLIAGGILILGSAAAIAQDDAPETPPPPSKDRLHIYAEVGMWVAQPAGLEYEPATEFDEVTPLDTTPISVPHGTEGELRYRVGLELPGGVGGFLLTWYANEAEQQVNRSTPGQFGFGQTLSFPLFAGINNDGLADGFLSQSDTQLRDLRIDYWRQAFTSEHVSGRWFVGYRDVTHQRSLGAAYFALAPLLPPLIPPLTSPTQPRSDLEPLPEFALMDSTFKGRGVEGGLDMRVPLLRSGRVAIEGGFALAALRGDIDSDYLSINAFYAVQGAPRGFPDQILVPPYDDDFEGFIPPSQPGEQPLPLIDYIQQIESPVGLTTTRRSSSADVIDAYLGARGKLGKGFELFAGFQSTHYEGVGVDLRPTVGSITNVGINVQAVTEVDSSVTYEGFYVGGSVRF